MIFNKFLCEFSDYANKNRERFRPVMVNRGTFMQLSNLGSKGINQERHDYSAVRFFSMDGRIVAMFGGMFIYLDSRLGACPVMNSVGVPMRRVYSKLFLKAKLKKSTIDFKLNIVFKEMLKTLAVCRN